VRPGQSIEAAGYTLRYARDRRHQRARTTPASAHCSTASGHGEASNLEPGMNDYAIKARDQARSTTTRPRSATSSRRQIVKGTRSPEGVREAARQPDLGGRLSSSARALIAVAGRGRAETPRGALCGGAVPAGLRWSGRSRSGDARCPPVGSARGRSCAIPRLRATGSTRLAPRPAPPRPRGGARSRARDAEGARVRPPDGQGVGRRLPRPGGPLRRRLRRRYGLSKWGTGRA